MGFHPRFEVPSVWTQKAFHHTETGEHFQRRRLALGNWFRFSSETKNGRLNKSPPNRSLWNTAAVHPSYSLNHHFITKTTHIQFRKSPTMEKWGLPGTKAVAVKGKDSKDWELCLYLYRNPLPVQPPQEKKNRKPYRKQQLVNFHYSFIFYFSK